MDHYDGNFTSNLDCETLTLPIAVCLGAIVGSSIYMRVILIVGCLLMAAILYFFYRSPPINKSVYGKLHRYDLVSPAQGTVMAIDKIPMEQALKNYGDFVKPNSYSGYTHASRIVIFLNVYNLHFQCAPCDGIIDKIIHKDGEFHPAGLIEKSQYNERTMVHMTVGKSSHQIVMVLLAGLLARRIVMLDPFDKDRTEMKRGDKISLIKLGSRVDMIIPHGQLYEINVRVGDNVEVGETVLATFKSNRQ